MKRNLNNFGVRKYESFSGRFTSIDPLWEKYCSWSPYVYSGNNPISLLDPTGTIVIAMDKGSINNIKNTLPKEIRLFVKFDNNGKLIANELNRVYSEDINFIVLKAIAEDKNNTVYVEERNDIIFQDENVNSKPNTIPMGKAIHGFIATPKSKDGKFLSIFPNASHVQINIYDNDKTKSKYTAHELYGHYFFFILGFDFEHNYQGGIDINVKLKEAIKKHENQAVKNYEE